MPWRFELLETSVTPLWDFGWFDRSRFRIDAPPAELCDLRTTLGAFLRDPISRRSFCTHPDPWGAATDHHGPFSLGRPLAGSFRERTHEELRGRVQRILDDSRFPHAPSNEQRRPADAWLGELERRAEIASELEEPLGADSTWEASVWWVFHEFACFSAERRELTIVVFGFD
jgi:hypothetical protein